MKPQVIVIGGGLAGLAAATALAQADVRVTLLESRQRLGGRASSIVDRETGQTIDNCQHVVMGCCTNFFHWCETIAARDLFERQARLFFVGPPGNGAPAIAPFEATSAFAPLHLASAFKNFSWLSSRDQRLLKQAIVELTLSKWGDDESFAYWLSRRHQSSTVIESFWKPVLVSALSESFERISFKYARKVLVDGFIRHRDGWEVWIPKVPLDEIYGTRVMSWMQRHDVDLRLNAGVARIVSNDETLLALYQQRRAANPEWQSMSEAACIDDDQSFVQQALQEGLIRAQAVELRNGERLAADEIVLAVPQHLVSGIVPTELQTHDVVRRLEQIETAPIGSVHLWLDRAITNLPHAVLINRLSQWLFDRGRSERGHYYQVVISAAFDLTSMTEQEVLDRVLHELSEIWPATRESQLLHGRLITEHKAVFSPRPGIDEWRSEAQSPIRNLSFAGDWTRTGWPSTMEGAVRSGYLAAENVLKRLGIEHRCLQPDLPTNWLTRLLT